MTTPTRKPSHAGDGGHGDRSKPEPTSAGNAHDVMVRRLRADYRARAIDTGLLRQVLVAFVRGGVRKVGLTRAVLGLSGGVDSALVAFLAAEALAP